MIATPITVSRVGRVDLPVLAAKFCEAEPILLVVIWPGGFIVGLLGQAELVDLCGRGSPGRCQPAGDVESVRSVWHCFEPVKSLGVLDG